MNTPLTHHLATAMVLATAVGLCASLCLAKPPGLKIPAQQVRLNLPPDFELPPYQKVGVGQEIGFGLHVFDNESDTVRVDLIEKPASASYDPITLTVVWRPTPKDKPHGRFVVRLTEKRWDTGTQRVFTHTFGVSVLDDMQPRPLARPLGDFVETVLTVHDPRRLHALNKLWPFDKVLERIGELEIAKLPMLQQGRVEKPDRKKMFRTVLKGLAELHRQPRIDPASKRFDKTMYDHEDAWRLMGVRIRLDLKWQEVRLIYKDFRSHEGIYIMPRFRLVGTGAKATQSAQHFNNKLMSQKVLDTFFKKDGSLNTALVSDRAAHAEALMQFVNWVLTYSSDKHPAAGATFLALPTGARLGGGSKRDKKGRYHSGDGWAWGVMKPQIVPPKRRGKKDQVQMKNVAFPGFVAAVKPSADGTKWVPTCPKRFDPHDPGHTRGYETLCRKNGLVALPHKKKRKIVPSIIDATNLHLAHKTVHTVSNLPLRDQRRDLFGAKGLTCAQCHIRNFGVRDLYDNTPLSPKSGIPTILSKPQPTSFFVIVPNEKWQPYAIDFQHKQMCQTRDAFKALLGVDLKIDCPLKGK
jgi:hypothetical protein